MTARAMVQDTRRVPSGTSRGGAHHRGSTTPRSARVGLIASVLAIARPASASSAPVAAAPAPAGAGPAGRDHRRAVRCRHGPVSRPGPRRGRRRAPIHAGRHGALLPQRHVARRPARAPGRQRRHLHGPRQRLAESRIATPSTRRPRTASGSTRAPAATTTQHQYFGEGAVGSQIHLAKNAVVLLHHLCYASGNCGARASPKGTLDTAKQRVDNFAAGFIRAGASAVLADAYASPSGYLAAVLGGGRSHRLDLAPRAECERQRLRLRQRPQPGLRRPDGSGARDVRVHPIDRPAGRPDPGRRPRRCARQRRRPGCPGRSWPAAAADPEPRQEPGPVRGAGHRRAAGRRQHRPAGPPAEGHGRARPARGPPGQRPLGLRSVTPPEPPPGRRSGSVAGQPAPARRSRRRGPLPPPDRWTWSSPNGRAMSSRPGREAPDGRPVPPGHGARRPRHVPAHRHAPRQGWRRLRRRPPRRCSRRSSCA